MRNAFAVLTGVEKAKTTPHFVRRGVESVADVPGLEVTAKEYEMKHTVKAMIRTIDRELANCKSLGEMDFRAGFLTGKIYEKAAAGAITKEHREALMKILYAKYETIRGLEIGGAGCSL